MSVEAPKQTGALEFLRRLFGDANKELLQQPTSSIIQPPRGLEEFADHIQSVIDGRFAAQRQKENDIEAAKAAQVAAGAEKERRVTQRQEELEREEWARPYKDEQERIARETTAILTAFRVVDRLQYIKDTAWGGKGEIRPLGSESFIAGKKASYTHQNYAYNRGRYLGGFELVYSYPSCKLIDGFKTEYGFDSSDFYHMQQYVPDTNSTRLSVRVLNMEQDSGEDRKELSISSVADVLFPDLHGAVAVEFFVACIPRETGESGALLESALMQEASQRVDRRHLPSQLGETARNKLAEVKRGSNWQKWKTINVSHHFSAG
ncbi:MAG: hypothetical protein A2802_01340 [Candidatus Woykebacteria bacterium RIFCSPHIGHO2_01_FULL_43_29]|uniref:Uncharacterized protein n=1 Tax=Candidatus Blackburnbacteria bacterium RIFCSPHIGHO2_12_FULL_41_13b TaxID=1797517 RepID=A0A1G1V962_9BACT|nr:MAG: hypothetical protein A3F61_01365 [Candidatus Blackburnbacteria bacterium RIFCSPHIGHO2_12_FULL_41_13b]OGY27703.1 MAG: hypothetical protein A2802_01340 [Candidatus Woykebacteria bacterium RIFCSPHIGHO2_01_FULL_43_29]